ncbi:uncharacterized protein LOC135394144 [Ornithodoros turicata]|uniref:uncharacterized protein LOC135394144 n=1 Tax=Ornithodoros turicata TaxID=34597 RepID=UPI0031399698
MMQQSRRLCAFSDIAVSRILEYTNSRICTTRVILATPRRNVTYYSPAPSTRWSPTTVMRIALNCHRGSRSPWPVMSSRWVNTSGVTQDPSHQHTVPWPYLERTINVNTCAELYSKWRREGRPGYKNAPEQGGLCVPVSYVHTGLDRTEKEGNVNSHRRPVVVIVTGAPGSYRDFAHLIPFLDCNGVDVISPVWPDLAFSRESGCWWHSSQEKTNLALDFLAAINVREVDMLVAHSSGSFPALRMITVPGGLKVKALTLLAPAGHRRITKMKPYWFTDNLGHLYKHRWAQRLCEKLGYAYLTITRHPLKKNMDNAILAMDAMLYADYDQLARDAETVKKNKLPTLVAVSDNDKLIDLAISLDFIPLLGGNVDKTWYYDKERNLVRAGQDTHVRALQFSKGSHYVFSRCADVVSYEVLRLLSSVLTTKEATVETAEKSESIVEPDTQSTTETHRVRLRLGEIR